MVNKKFTFLWNFLLLLFVFILLLIAAGNTKNLEITEKIFKKARTGNIITREICETGIKK